MKKEQTRIKKLIFGLVIITVAKAALLVVFGRALASFPLDLFLLIILSYFHPVGFVFAYLTAVIGINTATQYFSKVELWQPPMIYEILFLLLTTGLFAFFIKAERRAKKAAEGRLGGIETLSSKLSRDRTEGSRFSNLVISEETKENFFLDSAFRLSNALSKTMSDLKEITDAFTCSIFVLEGDRFKLCAAVSENSGNLFHEVPCEKGKNLLSWIEEHEKTLRLDAAFDNLSLGYYAKREGLEAFLGVPLKINDDEIRAILCIDRKEDPFSKDEEKLALMAGNVAAEYLRNSATFDQVRIEAEEFQGFYRLTKMLGNSLKLDVILDTVLDFSKEIVNYDLSAVVLNGEEEPSGLSKAKGEGAESLFDKKGRLESGITGWVREKKSTYHFTRNEVAGKVFPDLPKPLKGMGSFLCMPLMVGGEVTGIFITARRASKAYSAYETKLLEAIAAHLSMAVSNALIYNRMERMAITDGLTGLFNHRHFQETLTAEIERANRTGEHFAQLLTDIDFFKKVNDNYGHPAGDKILKEVSRIIKDSIRNIDFAARYGGEEFSVILVNADRKEALKISERIRKTVEKTAFDIGGGQKINITMSIGVAAFPADATSKERLVGLADATLYLAKEEGRNRVYLYGDVKGRIKEE